MKIIKYMTLLFCTLAVFSGSAFAKEKAPHSLIKDMLRPGAHPTEAFKKMRFIIILPTKSQEMIYESKSNLKWKGNKCKMTVASFKVIKGKKPKNGGLKGKTSKFKYPSHSLVKIFSGGVFDWNKSKSMKLDGKSYSGYTFKSLSAGKNKTGRLYMQGNKLKALSIGFPDEGLSHEKNMKANAEVWYFKYINGKPALHNVKKYSVQKKGVIPVIKYVTEKYSGF